MTFRPSHEGPWQYAHEAIEAIERDNCSHGCVFGARPGSQEWTEFGPGGTCQVLAEVSIGDEPVEALDLDGEVVSCRAFRHRPLDAEPPPPMVPGQLPLFGERPA